MSQQILLSPHPYLMIKLSSDPSKYSFTVAIEISNSIDGRRGRRKADEGGKEKEKNPQRSIYGTGSKGIGIGSESPLFIHHHDIAV